MPKKRGRRRRGRKGGVSGGGRATEVVKFEVAVGKVLAVKFSDFAAEHSSGRPTRPLRVRVQVASLVLAIASDGRAGYYAPAGCQIILHSPSPIVGSASLTSDVMATPLQLVTANGLTINASWPTSQWWDAGTSGTAIVLEILASCVGTNRIGGSAEQRLQGIATVEWELSREVVTQTCALSAL